MVMYLKQSTGVTLKIGPFLDDTDGKTAETGLTIAQADVRLSKNGGDIGQKNESSSCTHDELGIYGCPIDATDTATLGRLQLWVHKSGALPVWHDFMVVPANVWDSLFGADRLQVDVREKGDSSMGLTTQEKADANAEADTALSDYDSPTKSEMDTAFAALNDLSAAEINAEVDTALSDYDGPTKTEMDTGFAALNDPTAAAIADAIWDEAKSGHVGAGSFGEEVQGHATPAEVQTELGTYDAPTKAEMDTGFAALNDLSAVEVNAEVDTALADYDPPTKAELDTAVGSVRLSAAGVDDILDEVIEGTTTLRHAMKFANAMLAGKSTGGGTSSLKYRDIGDAVDRLTFTVDADGNRTAVSRNVT